MAAGKGKPAKRPAQKKALRGRIPVKRSINLTLINENKISPLKAIPGILLVLVLAALFGKFLVLDRIDAVSTAQSRAKTLENQVNESRALIAEYSGIEDAYAHYTITGMTQSELGLVDRVQTLNLVTKLLPARIVSGEDPLAEELLRLMRPRPNLGMNRGITINAWAVSGNTLTADIAGGTLEKLNQLARKLEESPIVDSCTISTANMSQRLESDEDVWARFIIYLQQAPEEPEEVTES